MTQHVLAVNTGYSTTKLGVFDVEGPDAQPILRARLRYGPIDPQVQAWDSEGAALPAPSPVRRGQEAEAVIDLLIWFEGQLDTSVKAVGHRVVHGGPQFRQDQHPEERRRRLGHSDRRGAHDRQDGQPALETPP